VLTIARSWTLSWTRPYFFKINFNIIFIILTSGLFPSGVSTHILYVFLISAVRVNVSRLSYPWFDHPNNIWWISCQFQWVKERIMRSSVRLPTRPHVSKLLMWHILTRTVGYKPVLHPDSFPVSNFVIELLSPFYPFIGGFASPRHPSTIVHTSVLVKYRLLHSWPLREYFWWAFILWSVCHIPAHRVLPSSYSWECSGCITTAMFNQCCNW
jgi:hypothetical protein